MKTFVTGVTGQLGYDVMKELVKRGHEVIGSGGRKGGEIQAAYSDIVDKTVATTVPYVQLDITSYDAVRDTLKKFHPDAIIHCAAWTAVDAAEDKENRITVDAINHLGTQYIAEAAKAIDAKMVYISTDYVFDGQGVRPWEPDDKCYAPLNVYGQSKLDGELAVSSILEKYFIARVA